MIKNNRLKIVKDPKTKAFRIEAKKLYLTYSQIKSDITKEMILNELLNKFKGRDVQYVISLENHEDGGLHSHVYLESDRNFHITSFDKLDILNHHGNYQVGKGKWNIIKYIVEDGNFITNMKLPIIDNKIVSIDEHLFSLAKFNYKHALNQFMEYYPSKWRSFTSAESNFKKIHKYHNPDRISNIIPIDQFQIPDKIKKWKDSGVPRKTLVLWGTSGTGKTEFIKSFITDLGGNPLFIRHSDQLKDYNPDYHTCIIFDDYSLNSLSREEKIHLFDVNNKSGINVKHSVITLQSGTDKVFTSNTIADFDLHETEINRRLVVVKIEEPLFNNLIEKEDAGSNPTISSTILDNFNDF
jgi:hypothetical protein